MRNKKTKTKLPRIGRRTVKNNFEYQVYKALQNILPRGATLEYETEKIPYVIEAEYLPDFIITLKDGRKIYIEAKGNGRSFDGTVRKKMTSVKRCNPLLDLRFVFFSDGKVGNVRKDGTAMRQGDWAKKEGFPFSIKEVPKDWLKDE
jgi:hypothetical protein